MSSARTSAEILLQKVATDIGAALEFDEQGVCTIESDEGQEVSLQIDEASNALMIYAPLKSAGHQNRESLFAWLLELNLQDEGLRGSIVGLDRATNMLALRYQHPLEAANPAGLGSVLADFFETVDQLLAKTSEFQRDSSAEPASAVTNPPQDAIEAELPRVHGPSDFA